MLLVQEEYINSDKVVKIAKLPVMKPIKLVGLPLKPSDKALLQPLPFKKPANPLKLKPVTEQQ